MKEIKIGEIIKGLRGRNGVSQEFLADVCGVSMQAVSKWENSQSYPDITLLPVLADYFQVTLDYLLTGKKEDIGDSGILKNDESHIREMLQDNTKENILYIVQYRNGRILDKKAFDSGEQRQEWDAIKISFEEKFRDMENGLQVEIWGDANIEGSVYGRIDAGGAVNCEEVNGNVDAGGAVSSADINGDVSAGSTVDCADINGSVSAGGEVNCGDIDGNVAAGGEVNCGDIGGNVAAGGEVNCGDVGGNIIEM